MNYSRGLMRLWLVCWALVTGYYVLQGLETRELQYDACSHYGLQDRGCSVDVSAFIGLPIFFSILAFIFVPILFIVARAMARWVWRGFLG